MRMLNFKQATKLVAILALAGAAATEARAQAEQPTVFAHGVKSDSGTWHFMAGYLKNELQISPVAKTTTWYKREATQSAQLIQALNSDGRTAYAGHTLPFVAHSNGGLVARRFSLDDAADRNRMLNLVTIATPHAGAQLANNFIAGNFVAYSEQLSSALFDPVNYYSSNDPAWPSWVGNAIDAWNGAWQPFTTQLNQMLCAVGGMCYTFEDGVLGVAPVFRDVAIGSDAINTLNSGANLAREQASIARSVYLYTSISPENGLFHFLFPHDYDTWGNIRDGSTALYYVLYDWYQDSEDIDLWYNSDLWLAGALELQAIDANWYYLIGSLISYGQVCSSQGCHLQLSTYMNDGLVDHRSAGFAAAYAQQVAGNLAHTEQLNSAAVAEAVKNVLHNQFGVPVRTSWPSGGGPDSVPHHIVVVHGPTSAQPGNSCYWYASTSVNNPRYEWRVDGTVLGTNQEFWYRANQSFTLHLLVYNDQFDMAQAEIDVSIAWENGRCYVE